ncbi:MAG: hypothetical protein ACTSW7_00845 [Candidatus Thorarchaeota archaeon]|nr:hypothetical protein [Thermoplasmatales archaeon]
MTIDWDKRAKVYEELKRIVMENNLTIWIATQAPPSGLGNRRFFIPFSEPELLIIDYPDIMSPSKKEK